MKYILAKGLRRWWWCKECKKYTWQDKVKWGWECRECA